MLRARCAGGVAGSAPPVQCRSPPAPAPGSNRWPRRPRGRCPPSPPCVGGRGAEKPRDPHTAGDGQALAGLMPPAQRCPPSFLAGALLPLPAPASPHTRSPRHLPQRQVQQAVAQRLQVVRQPRPQRLQRLRQVGRAAGAAEGGWLGVGSHRPWRSAASMLAAPPAPPHRGGRKVGGAGEVVVGDARGRGVKPGGMGCGRGETGRWRGQVGQMGAARRSSATPAALHSQPAPEGEAKVDEEHGLHWGGATRPRPHAGAHSAAAGTLALAGGGGAGRHKVGGLDVVVDVALCVRVCVWGGGQEGM